jgi:chromosome segregation ATPase
MKTFSYTGFIILLAISLAVGCATTKDITGDITSKVTSITSDVDQNLFAQVPEEMRKGVKKAEFDLKVFEEKMKLVELKKELASTQKQYAGYEQDRAQTYHKEAAIAVDIAKIEAIDSSGLGEKDDNIKTIAELKAKKLGVEADRIKINAKLASTERRINDLTEQIKAQEEKIKDMKLDKWQVE